jgi:hypothetical protein
MKSTISLILTIAFCVLGAATAFAPTSKVAFSQRTKPPKMGFMGDEEPPKLTRDNEPEEYFKTYVAIGSSVVRCCDRAKPNE